MPLKGWKARFETARRGTLACLEQRRRRQLDAEVPDYPHTLGDLARHIAEAEEFWVTRVLMGGTEPFYDHLPKRFPTLIAIVSNLRTYRRLLDEWLDSHDESDLDEEVRWCRDDGTEETFSTRWVLWHLLEHELHHRAQMTMLLRMIDVTPPFVYESDTAMTHCDPLRFWPAVRSQIDEALSGLSQEQLDFVPEGYTRSIGDLARHIAETQQGWLQGVVLGGKPGPDHTLDEFPDFASIQADLDHWHSEVATEMSKREGKLDEVVTFTHEDGRVEESTVCWVFWHLLEHEVHHRAQIFALMRMQGAVPPQI
jgi:uncharacterized damage-inducible protein DinB